MKLNGRRESNHVEDRRGMGGGAKAGMGGLGAIIIVALITLAQGGSLSDVVGNVFQQQLQGQVSEQAGNGHHTFTADEEEAATFSKQVLGSLEEVWTSQFSQNGLNYEYPTMVLFTGSVSTACGAGSSQMGPFYCSADQKLYLDLSFFADMKNKLGIDINDRNSFAYAYVIAHEVGHHVENLRGILGKAHAAMNRTSREEANKISVQLELLADYYAGCWAHYENEKYRSLTDADLREAIDAARKIGDDYLQKQAQGHANPETFTHGTSEQRMYWLKKGFESGDWNTTTFDYDI
ncbi:MAG: neutral zinc metallopeptidase [Prevotellaceae bacterium]|nr:neutral zinc metallopeptidase [Prevotella sp.]MDD7529555.1 neutral zinc metallopeptidase [Prevotellaceae bacterium]MDY2634135.1 neutral zinc metallopeptidase [Prevotella sp.]